MKHLTINLSSLLFAAVLSAQTFTSLFSLDGSHGTNPWSALVEGPDGAFYGTTISGGANYFGTIYKFVPDGALTTLYTFCSQSGCTDGSEPFAGMILASDGNFYGTTSYGGVGGAYGFGTIFKMAPDGTLTTLYRFCSQIPCTDGTDPIGPLVQATDGDFYGTTYSGGAAGHGTLFKITPSGNLTTLYSFCLANGCPDGQRPIAGLMQAAAGQFYGTTPFGGAYNEGTVFTFSPGAGLTTLHSFCASGGVCSDGAEPSAGLIQAGDGNFYGTTANYKGTVFKMTPGGTLTTLYTFCMSSNNCIDGIGPVSGLFQAGDGNIYGTTEYGGPNLGTVFRIAPDGSLTVVYSFCAQGGTCTDGSQPMAAPVQGRDGNLYGTTQMGGANNGGTVYRLSGLGPTALRFIPMPPCRIVDTRDSGQPAGFGPPAIAGGTFISYAIPDGACRVPFSAQAYSLNVTVVPHGELGFLTVYPAGQNRPLASTLNSLDARVKANAAILPAGTGGAIDVFATNDTDVVLDINGYFVAMSNPTALEFYPLAPCRLVDTRADAPQTIVTGTLAAGSTTTLPVLTGNCQVPSSVEAYALNFTLVPPPGAPVGYLTVWPAGHIQPIVSTLNDPTGTVEANAAIAPAGSNGDIDVFVNNKTDLLVDINGYFAPSDTGGLSLYTLPPCRVLDTRNPPGAPHIDGTMDVSVLGIGCGGTAAAQAYVFNATVVPPGFLGYLTLWPAGEAKPVVSTLNAYDGQVTSNLAIVPTNNAQIKAFVSNSTHLVLDLFGYFAP